MTTQEADEKLAKIDKLADEIENDEELREIDSRYATIAMWIETDISAADHD